MTDWKTIEDAFFYQLAWLWKNWAAIETLLVQSFFSPEETVVHSDAVCTQNKKMNTFVLYLYSKELNLQATNGEIIYEHNSIITIYTLGNP